MCKKAIFSNLVRSFCLSLGAGSDYGFNFTVTFLEKALPKYLSKHYDRLETYL